MDTLLAIEIRRNRVQAMALIGASPDAWAEVLLLIEPGVDYRASLLAFQAWCRRAAEEAENCRAIANAQAWVSSLAQIEESKKNIQTPEDAGQVRLTFDLEDERQWVQAQIAGMPPPERAPGWSLSATLLDLIRYSVIEPNACFNPMDWVEEATSALQLLTRQRLQSGESVEQLLDSESELLSVLALDAERFKSIYKKG